MSETFPTPSIEFSKVATQRDIAEGIPSNESRYSLLEAREAAYAAKPFMDVAVELYKAQDDKELALENTDLNTLIDYAERRARFAAEKGNVRELSDDEQKILDVYKAQAECDKVKLDMGDTYLDIDSEDVNNAIVAAQDKFDVSSDREDRRKLKDLEYKLDRYTSYLNSGKDRPDGEFSTNAGHAAILLTRMNAETGATLEWNDESVDEKTLLLEAHNLRTEAEMLHFIGNHMKQGSQETKTTDRKGAESQEAPETLSFVPDDEQERAKFIKEYFTQNIDVDDGKNADVLKEYVAKELTSRLERVRNMRANGRNVRELDKAALIFGAGTFTDATINQVSPELRFAYRLLKSEQPKLTYSEFDSMTAEEVASSLGVDVREVADDYDMLVMKKPIKRNQFLNIDR